MLFVSFVDREGFPELMVACGKMFKDNRAGQKAE